MDAAAPSPTNQLAVVSVVAGAASWLGLPLAAALVAIVCGHLARAQIREKHGLQAGDGLALGGLVLGYANVLLACGAIALAGVIAAAALGIVAIAELY
jgi:hypothetical protein